MTKGPQTAGKGRGLVTDEEIREAMENIRQRRANGKEEAARLGISPPSLSTRMKKLRELAEPQPNQFLVDQLRNRIAELEAENDKLSQQVYAFAHRAKGGGHQHERRDQIEAVLESTSELLTYDQIADLIDSNANTVRSTIASMNGTVEKFTMAGSNKVYVRNKQVVEP